MRNLRLRESSYPWVLFFLFLATYLLYPTNLPYIDGLYYAYHVENMPLADTFHPHHLLFLTINQLIFSALHLAIPNLRGLTYFQSFNSFLGALTLIILYRLLLGLFKRPLGAFIGTFFYASTFGFWHHATDANIYIGFNLLMTIILKRFLLDENHKKTGNLIITAFLTAFATLIHQLGIFMIFPIGAYLLANDKDTKRSFKPLVMFLGVYFISVIIPYLLVFIFSVSNGKPSIQLFASWITAYGSNRIFWPFLYHDVYYVLSVISRSQFNAIFHVIPMEKIIYRGNVTGEGASLLNLFNFTFAIILVLIIERIHFINFRANPSEKIIYRKVLAWMTPFFIFFIFFAPENYFYRILYLAPLVIFTGGLLESSTIRDKRTLKPFLFIFVMFTLLYNTWDGIIPESRMMNNPYIVDAISINQEINSEDLVVFSEQERYLAAVFRYYFNRKCLHAMSQSRYKKENEERIEKAKIETALFMKENFKGIFFSNYTMRMGVETYYFSLNNFPPPHPEIMVLDKDQIIQIGQVLTSRGTYFKARVEEPVRKKIDRDGYIEEFNEAWEVQR